MLNYDTSSEPYLLLLLFSFFPLSSEVHLEHGEILRMGLFSYTYIEMNFVVLLLFLLFSFFCYDSEKHPEYGEILHMEIFSYSYIE